MRIAGNLVAELQGHTDYVTSASFSPDGERIVTASSDNTARVWLVGSLDQLLAQGCQWLRDYFITHPKQLETLQVCQNNQ